MMTQETNEKKSKMARTTFAVFPVSEKKERREG
jgi:hypothetical protein